MDFMRLKEEALLVLKRDLILGIESRSSRPPSAARSRRESGAQYAARARTLR